VVVRAVVHKKKAYLGDVGAQFPSPSLINSSTTF
jgi:hypothetical protein